MKIIHSLPKGQRIFKGSRKYNNKRINNFYAVTCITDGTWWLEEDKKWGNIEDAFKKEQNYGTHNYKVNSIKTFKRQLRKWSKYLPKGTEFILCSAYVNGNVYGIL